MTLPKLHETQGGRGGKLNSRALPNIYETLGKISRSIPKTKNETLGKVVSRTLPKPKRETLGKLNSRTKAKLNGTLGKQSRTLPKLNGTLGKLNRTLLRGEPRGTTTMKQRRPESAQNRPLLGPPSRGPNASVFRAAPSSLPGPRGAILVEAIN